ncbi:hypothetical protein AUC43_02495 [Hymenobacter sedentarius]|uniref:Glyoxalase n=1 Tax=Hymenobacter sedentarius TaxID=1411621 RepID=A0A0U3SU40_9BACT|nr:hypothetical protein [Hymenobacter sedentarius]ALW84067.1 hypothetical protein AUC43_02495 [Hymenobacter sedentarius]
MNADSSPLASVRPDAALLALRPAIAAVQLSDGPAATVGDFLHATLRPVLKLQNNLLLAVVTDFVLDHHMALAKASPTDQERQLAELLTRNTKLRYTVIGLITGCFTDEEYAFYRQHRAELNRRLLELAQRRVLDQTSRVVALTAEVPAS